MTLHPDLHADKPPELRTELTIPSYEGVLQRPKGSLERSDVLQQMHTYEAAPRDLDPRTASAALLRRHGLPRRPEAADEPRLAEVWHRQLSRPFEYVPAALSVDHVLSQRDPLWRRPVEHPGHGPEGAFGPSGWGGVVARPQKAGTSPALHANTVFGQWTVPGIFPASNPGGDIVAGFWVGLDGWTNGQVLQAGVAVTVTPSAQVSWWAWTEWYTTTYQDPAVRIDNFPVNVGDTVTVLVCAPTTTHGFVSMQNLTTGQVTSVGIDARPGITSEGATAEWIVEGISADLPVFLPSVTFSSCSAGTKNTSFDMQPNGFTTEIAGSSGSLTQSTIANDTTGIVQWKGWT